MENIIRFILLVVGAIIILGILWDGLRRKKRQLLDAEKQQQLNEQDHDEVYRKKILGESGLLNIEGLDFSEDKEVFSPEPKEISFELTPHVDESALVVEEGAVESMDVVQDEAETTEETLTESMDMAQSDTRTAEDDLTESMDVSPEIKQAEKDDLPEEELAIESRFISIRIAAMPGRTFGGYGLLQSLLNNNLDFGDLHLFHRYADVDKTKKLFSLASADEPGDFDLSRMSEFSCNGLILYMNVAEHEYPLEVFEQMLNTAEDLVMELDGVLMSSPKRLWTDETTEAIRKSLVV